MFLSAFVRLLFLGFLVLLLADIAFPHLSELFVRPQLVLRSTFHHELKLKLSKKVI